jgi:hypothetical protein
LLAADWCQPLTDGWAVDVDRQRRQESRCARICLQTSIFGAVRHSALPGRADDDRITFVIADV